jgi:hypothetical protein
MPRKLTAKMSFETYEDEVLFTRAAVAADPDAAPLASHTDGWLALIKSARDTDIKARTAVANADAARIVANGRLDAACVAFGDDLYTAVGKDTSSPRWRKFFAIAVSRFVRQALSRQVRQVAGWLAQTDDAALTQHRSALTTWSGKADAALTQTAALAVVRGEAWTVFEQLAEDLTRERDGLRDALASVARDKGLPRTWPDLFFRVESRGRAVEGEPEEPAEPPAMPGAAAPAAPGP